MFGVTCIARFAHDGLPALLFLVTLRSKDVRRWRDWEVPISRYDILDLDPVYQQSARHAQGFLNETSDCDMRNGEEEEAEQISYRTRIWLTTAILSSELLLAFNITMVKHNT